MSFWDRLFGRQPASGSVAKDRLQLVLVHDRSELMGLTPELMEQMRDELIAVLSKYVDIDREEMDISVSQGREQSRLVANIPLRPQATGRVALEPPNAE